jgi:hypothetical protein
MHECGCVSLSGGGARLRYCRTCATSAIVVALVCTIGVTGAASRTCLSAFIIISKKSNTINANSISMQIGKKKSKIFGRVNKKKQICFFFKPHPEIGKFFSNNHHHHTSCPAIKPDLTQKIKAVFVRSQWSE